jgi:putative PIN family toxin of toxin-antitoxin system
VRVFLDTNVLVAAFTTRGLCDDVVRVAIADHTLLTGEVNLQELRRVLRQRMKVPPDVVTRVEDLLRARTVIPKPKDPPDVPVRDPDDLWVLASAIEGDAEVLVTGDQDLLAVADIAPLPIVTPREFWEMARQRTEE